MACLFVFLLLVKSGIRGALSDVLPLFYCDTEQDTGPDVSNLKNFVPHLFKMKTYTSRCIICYHVNFCFKYKGRVFYELHFE